MNVLILGSGGRETSLYMKLQKSRAVSRIYILPGNGSLENRITGVDIINFPAISGIIREKSIQVVVVGPEVPLVAGIKSHLESSNPGILVFGPDEKGAMLEGSKIFSYNTMQKLGIPTAKSSAAHSLEEAEKLMANHSFPLVIKADGLAAGKGVSIHHEGTSAREQLKKIFQDQIFQEAGNAVLLQDFMTGTEASLFAVCNGKEAVYLPTARDYKAAYDGGDGPNTGGMGSVCPGEALSPQQIAYADRAIVRKIIDEFAYTGILYVGLMVHSEKAEDISVVEFNCRLGDPETQSVLPMVDTDLFPYILWACGVDSPPPMVENNGFYSMPVKSGFGVNVVVAAAGYPEKYPKNLEINLPASIPEGIEIVSAGMELQNGKLLSTGGRIFNIFAHGEDKKSALQKVYSFIEKLKQINDFSRFHYRSDIGR